MARALTQPAPPQPALAISIQRGPSCIATGLDIATVRAMVDGGAVRADDVLWLHDRPFPVRAQDLPGLYSNREYMTALLLALLLGPFGVDRFYLGHRRSAILKLALALSFPVLWLFAALTMGVGFWSALMGAPGAETGATVGFAVVWSLFAIAPLCIAAAATWTIVDIALIAARKLGDADGLRLR